MASALSMKQFKQDCKACAQLPFHIIHIFYGMTFSALNTAYFYL